MAHKIDDRYYEGDLELIDIQPLCNGRWQYCTRCSKNTLPVRSYETYMGRRFRRGLCSECGNEVIAPWVESSEGITHHLPDLEPKPIRRLLPATLGRKR